MLVAVVLLIRLQLRIHDLLALVSRQKVTLLINQVAELLQVHVDRILVHLLAELVEVVLRRIVLEDSEVDLFEAAERVDGTAFTLRILEEVLRARIHPLVGVLSWASTTAAARGRVAQLAVGALRVFLLHMSVKGWVRQVSLLAVLAFKVTTHIVVFGPALASLPHAILTLVILAVIVRPIVIVRIVVGVGMRVGGSRGARIRSLTVHLLLVVLFFVNF